jgi:hypothetical protein
MPVRHLACPVSRHGEVRELKRKNAELESTIEILKAATPDSSCGTKSLASGTMP